MDFEFSLFLKSLPALAPGAVLTAELAVISIAIGTAIGTNASSLPASACARRRTPIRASSPAASSSALPLPAVWQWIRS
jgi:ABC-type amino acid transport system permease subunit